MLFVNEEGILVNSGNIKFQIKWPAFCSIYNKIFNLTSSAPP